MNVKTACPLDCWDTCSIIAQVENGQVIQLQGDETHPVTQGFLCGKGRRLKDRMYSSDRIVHPLKKVDGEWQEISWAQANHEIAGKITAALKKRGHHSILHVYDWGSGTVLKNLNQRFFYLLGGCTETVGSLCWEAGLEAQRYDFGEARSHAPSDTAKSNAIVVWGRNVSVTNIHMTPFIKQAQAKGAKVVVVNPLPTDMDGRADLCIHPRPGSDAALALGVLSYCNDRGWLDDAFLRDHSLGWEELVASLNEYTLEKTSEATDVAATDIIRLAELYGQTRPVATLLGLGMQRYPGGGNTIRAIDALAAATGQVGVSGGGVNYAHRQVASFLDQDALTLRDRANVREFTRGDQAEQILNASPEIEVMFVTRTNAVTQVPNTTELLAAYDSIPCKVVVDMFMTKTAEVADYFLPCTSVLEEEDFVFSTMWHGYLTYIHKAVEPQGEAKPDWKIFADLATLLGIGEEMSKPLDAWFEMALSPLQPYQMDLNELRKQGTIELPLATVPWLDKRFATPSGKYEFVSGEAVNDGHSGHAVYVESHESSTVGPQGTGHRAYPYALLTIHPRISENSQHKDVVNLPEYPWVEVSPQIAHEMNLGEAELAKLWNDQASLTVRVRIKPGGHPYTIKLESGWWGQGVTINHFTKSYQADFGQQTAQYDCTCKIEPIAQEMKTAL
jgi:anaerobic selenocysteine-containing dehydrogenase